MKLQRFNEISHIYSSFKPSNDEEMKNYILAIISSMIDMRSVPYTDDEWEIDPKSIELAATEIIKELKSIGMDFDLLYATKKYNL